MTGNYLCGAAERAQLEFCFFLFFPRNELTNETFQLQWTSERTAFSIRLQLKKRLVPLSDEIVVGSEAETNRRLIDAFFLNLKKNFKFNFQIKWNLNEQI